MRIAFASCFDALADGRQEVWGKVRAEKPDLLVLLGDSIYMDFFPTLGRPRKWSDEKFAAEMHKRYKAQWAVPPFRELLAVVPEVCAIWDDHDFAWNNSRGAGVSGKDLVPKERRLVSRGLYQQFLAALRTRPLLQTYPDMPALDVLKAQPDMGIQESRDFGDVRVVMLDGRTFREKPRDDRKASLLGDAQRAWLSSQILNWPGVCVVCSGSTLYGGGESWSNYLDFSWLDNLVGGKFVVLSGDIHENVFRRHKGARGIVEVTSSGAARPGLGGDEGNFGTLDINGAVIDVRLFDGDGAEREKKVIL
jgi:hypothetical protein